MLDWLHDHPRLTALIFGPVFLAGGLTSTIGVIMVCEWIVSTTWGLTILVCALLLGGAYWIGRMVIVDAVNELWKNEQEKKRRREKGLVM